MRLLALALATLACSSSGDDTRFPIGDGPRADAAAAPDGACAPGAVSFSRQVVPIFDQFCSCHQAPMAPSGSGDLFLHGSIARGNLLRPSAECMGALDRVKPGRPDESYLLHKVLGMRPDGGPLCAGMRMPRGEPALAPERIGVLRAWIAEGACAD